MHRSYTLICNLGAVPERFDRVTKHFTVMRPLNALWQPVVCFVSLFLTKHSAHRGKQRHIHSDTCAYTPVVHRQTHTPVQIVSGLKIVKPLLLPLSVGKLQRRQWKMLGVQSNIKLKLIEFVEKLLQNIMGKHIYYGDILAALFGWAFTHCFSFHLLCILKQASFKLFKLLSCLPE